MLNIKKIKMRRLTQEEAEKLGTTDEIFVTADSEMIQETGVLAPAHLIRPGLDFEGGFFGAETVFGEKVSASLDAEDIGIYIADKDGAEMPVLQSAGLYANLALFFPDSDVSALGALYSFIRDKFGEGVVQKWHGESALVPDARYDVYEVAVRGRKGADGPKRVLVEGDVYQQYVQYVPISDGSKMEVQPHQEAAKKIPTI